MRKAKKRSSDEFEIDNVGTLVSKRSVSSGSPKDKGKDEKGSSRKHRSLGKGLLHGPVDAPVDIIRPRTSTSPFSLPTGRSGNVQIFPLSRVPGSVPMTFGRT
jgi:hypothetical protein